MHPVVFLVFVGIVTAAAGPIFLRIDLGGLVFDLPSPLAFFEWLGDHILHSDDACLLVSSQLIGDVA